jgi:phosphonoacetaldehyde hydrolase
MTTYPHQAAVPEVIILDWAGTTVDFGCLAPVQALLTIFASRGISLDSEEARGPMGLEKLAHLRSLLALPNVTEQWQKLHGESPDETDTLALYARFREVQLSILPQHADLVPGWLEALAELREQGLRIGSNSGYDAEMMQVLTVRAAASGYAPDTVVCSEDVAHGRPHPDMAWKAAMRLGARAAHVCVKVDDTPAGVEEGRNAGMWSVGVTDSGNEVGLPLQTWKALPAAKAQERREQAAHRLRAAGAHEVVDTVANLGAAVARIASRLRAGERP